ncbi:MAG TPA: DUF2332 domain-containing protein [Streptosporangiaceae bacterium]
MATTAGDAAEIAQEYRAFARQEARGRSPAYESLAESVADDEALVSFVASLPAAKRQPNLLFAAARYLGAVPGLPPLRDLVSGSRAELTEVILSHRTQTNEPARCATLLPALAQLPQPLALIEVGASAGLTLLVDQYSYDYAGHRLAGRDPQAPTLHCEPRGPVPLPAELPEVAWRAGLDLHPLDVNDADDVRWLSCLVWPGEGDREERLARAVASARRDPPTVHRGDLLTDLPALAAQAPAGTTLVVYHTSVLTYVAPGERWRFFTAVADLGAVWLSNEGPGTVPGIASTALEVSASVLIRDGRTPLAHTDPHGTWLRWLG